jgi:hypothetical protein
MPVPDFANSTQISALDELHDTPILVGLGSPHTVSDRTSQALTQIDGLQSRRSLSAIRRKFCETLQMHTTLK